MGHRQKAGNHARALAGLPGVVRGEGAIKATLLQMWGQVKEPQESVRNGELYYYMSCGQTQDFGEELLMWLTGIRDVGPGWTTYPQIQNLEIPEELRGPLGAAIDWACRLPNT